MYFFGGPRFPENPRDPLGNSWVSSGRHQGFKARLCDFEGGGSRFEDVPRDLRAYLDPPSTFKVW